MPSSMQPVKATFASQEPIVNQTFATPAPLTTTPLTEGLKVKEVINKRATAEEALTPEPLSPKFDNALSSMEEQIKKLSEIYKQPLFTTDNIYTGAPDTFKETIHNNSQYYIKKHQIF